MRGNPDQATAEHPQDAAAGLGAARMVICLAWRDGRKMAEARRRIPVLLRVPAPVHWLSVAQLLEPLDLRPRLRRGIGWMVVGGETGAQDARYMEPDWARDLRDQC